MFILRALMKGLTGGYIALTLLTAVAVISRADNPQALSDFMAKARWMPGVGRMEVAMMRAQDPQIVAPAPGVVNLMPKAPEVELTELQKLRQRTYGGAGNGVGTPMVATEGN